MSKLNATATGISVIGDTSLQVELQTSGTTRALVNASGQIEAKATTGTAPLIISSTTEVANLNAAALSGIDIGQTGVNYIPYANASGNFIVGSAYDNSYKAQIGVIGYAPNQSANGLKIKSTDSVGTFNAEFFIYSDGGASLSSGLMHGGSTYLRKFDAGQLYLNEGGGNVLIGTTTDRAGIKARVKGYINSFGVVSEPFFTTDYMNGTEGSPTAVVNGDRIGGVAFNGQYDSTDGHSSNGAAIRAKATGNWTSTTNCPTELIVSVNNGSGLYDALTLTKDGRLFGTQLHNNAGAVTGTTNQYIASGTYTPTLTAVNNIGSIGAYVCQWIRVGNVVTVSGAIDIDAVAATTLTTVGVSLPIASDFTSSVQAGGSAVAGATAVPFYISADATNNRLSFETSVNTSTANHTYWFSCTYLIL